MAGKVFFSVSMSLDGFIAPEGRMGDPEWTAQWIGLQQWILPQREPALDQARKAAGDRDVRIAGGGATILEYVIAALIDEFTIALSPVLFGSGIRLFEGVDAGRATPEPVRAGRRSE